MSPISMFCTLYEVSSIKNVNLFIKYEGIKLQKSVIARELINIEGYSDQFI